MKATVELDEELVPTAREYRPKTRLSKLLNEALKALIHMEASRRLAALGGTEPNLKKIKRTRADKL
ncbi:MAG: type II toxin-antitoxin system VapB family antitoxin [Acidobacteriaceae bacterium]